MKKVQQFFRDLKLRLKLKWQRRQTNFLIQFSDFFPFEFFFKFCGFPFLQSYNARRDFIWQICFGGYNLSTIMLAIASLISAGIYFNTPDSFLLTTESFAFFWVFAAILFKGYYVMFFNRMKIVKVLEKLDEHFPLHCLDQDKFKVASYLKKLKIISIITIFVYIAVTLNFVTFPLQRQIYGLLTSQSVEWEKILVLKYPFDVMKPIAYWLVFIFEFCEINFGAFLVLSTDLFYAELLCVLSMEFDILSQLIAEIDLEDGDENAIRELKKLVDIHQQLIEVAENLEEIFSRLLLANLLAFIFVLCIGAFLTVVKVFNSGFKSHLIIKNFFRPIPIWLLC